MFRDVEERTAPDERNDKNARECCAVATKSRPHRGHKGLPFMSLWTGVDWEGNVCDIMHDYKTVCEMLLKGLVGKGQHGWYKSWKDDNIHRTDCKVFGVFPEIYDEDVQLPWRLGKDDIAILDQRVRDMMWPHYMDILLKKGVSFWRKSETCPKCKDKSYIFLVLLPTLLRGFVPSVHRAILTLVYGLRLLDGQVVSAAEAEEIGVMAGSHVLKKTAIPHAGELVVLGLVLLEGSFPIAHLNPALHHLVHYPHMVTRVGCLRWFSMFSFERNNKKIKGLARNGHHALSGVANNIQLDIATRFDAVAKVTSHEECIVRIYETVGRAGHYK